MQPLTRVGLARLILLLVCASGVVPARDEYGCRPVRPKCSPIPSDAGAELKCKRCGTSLLDLANDESWKTEPKDPSHCEAMMKDYYNYNEGSDQYYDTSKGALAQCSSSGMLLYDGALECFKLRESNSASTLVSVIGTCITAKSGFYDCLCRHNIDKKQIFALSNCFGRGNVPDMEKCPNKDPTITAQLPQNLQQVRGTKGRTIYVPNGGGNKWGNGRRSTVDDGSDNNVNTASNGRSSDGSNDGHNDGSDDDYVVDDWPPNLDNQFSPLLDDVGVSFYLDVWERVVLVNTTTLDVIYYVPYHLYTALSYDTVFPGQKINNLEQNLVRRCWLYPYSDSVWCYQWWMLTEDLHDYGYKDSTTTTILGPSEVAATVTASTGDTTVPAEYTSVAYTTAGSVPSATTRTAIDAPATTSAPGSTSPGSTSPGSTSPGSTAKPTKGSSSAPASRAGSKFWLAGIILAVMYDAF